MEYNMFTLKIPVKLSIMPLPRYRFSDPAHCQSQLLSDGFLA